MITHKTSLLIAGGFAIAITGYVIGAYQGQRALRQSITDFAEDINIAEDENELRQMVNDFIDEVHSPFSLFQSEASVLNSIDFQSDDKIKNFELSFQDRTARIVSEALANSTQYYLHFENDDISGYASQPLSGASGFDLNVKIPAEIQHVGCLIQDCPVNISRIPLNAGIYKISLISYQDGKWLKSSSVTRALEY